MNFKKNLRSHVASRAFPVLFVSILISSCATPQAKKQAAAPEPLPTVAPKPAPRPKVLSIEERMLAKAERAFQQGRLFEPESDNAYFSYHAVLVLNPDNKDAKAGLDALLIRSADEVRDKIKASQIRSAREQLNALNGYFPGAPLLDQLRNGINAVSTDLAPKTLRSTALSKGPKPKMEEINEGLLAKRDPLLIGRLNLIALNLSKTDEYILIYAHSDADARWVYQTMRDAVPHYRIRGDVRIGKPHIRFLPPID